MNAFPYNNTHTFASATPKHCLEIPEYAQYCTLFGNEQRIVNKGGRLWKQLHAPAWNLLLVMIIYFIMKIVQVVHTEERRRRKKEKTNKQTNEQTNKHKPKTHTMCQKRTWILFFMLLFYPEFAMRCVCGVVILAYWS